MATDVATIGRPMDEEYFAAPGLSQSGMKDLAVSPLRYWYLHINPDRPKIEPSPEMEFGSALHCLVLEPSKFHARYACQLIPPEDCLDTIEDLRRALDSVGLKAKGSAKGPIIEQVQAALPNAPILSVLKQQHAEENAGKVIFKTDDWQRIWGAAEALLAEPRVQELLSQGEPEVPMSAKDPETGVILKGKADWLRPDVTVDLKTFSQKRGKSIDKSITDAILYEAYYRQAYLYGMIRVLLSGEKKAPPDFVFAFVESEPPHEVRLRIIRPKAGTEPTLLWERARIEVRGLIRTYADFRDEFGDKPWRYAQEYTQVMDEEIPGLAY